MQTSPPTRRLARLARSIGRVVGVVVLVGWTFESTATEPLPKSAEVVVRDLAGGETHRYELEWLHGEEFWLSAHQDGIDLAVALVNAESEIRLSVDSPSGRWGAERMRFRVEPGDAAVEVRALSQHSPRGRYRLIVEPRQPPSLENRPRDSAERAMTAAGRLYQLGGRDRQQRALDYYRNALDGWTDLGRDAEAAETLLHIAVLERNLESPSRALETLRDALEGFARLGDRQGQARAWLEIARTSRRLGDSQDADAAFERSGALWRPLGDRHGLARTLGLQGLLHMRGDPERAEALHRETLALARELGDRSQESASLNNLGGLYELSGRFDDALEHYERAARIYETIENRRLEARVWNNIASIHRRKGRLQEALEGYSASFEIREALEDRRGQALVLNNLGLTWLELGDTAQARDALTRAVTIRREIEDPEGEATNLHNLGLVHAEIGAWNEALEAWHEALALRRSLGNRRGEAATLIALGQAAYALDRLDAAQRHLEDALAVYDTIENPWHRAKARWVLGQVLTAAGRPEDAVAMLERSIETYRALDDAVAEGNVLLALAQARRAVDDGLPTAYEHASAALDRLEAVRSDVESSDLRTSFLARHAEAFEATIDLAMELDRRRPDEGWAARALEISERSRARSLLDRLRASKVAASLQQSETLAVREVQALLDPETLLLAYSLGEERSFLWAVTAQSVEGHELPGRAAIETAAREAHEGFRVLDPRQRNADAKAARRVADLLLAPVADRLEARRLAIVADGALHYLPFAALPHPSASAEPLLARHEIVRLPSASTLGTQRRLLAERPPAREKLAVLADPVFGPSDPRLAAAKRARIAEGSEPAAPSPLAAPPTEPLTWGRAEPTYAATRSGEVALARLPWSRWEAERIVERVGPASLLALGFDADLETIRGGGLRDYRWIHFATHGVVESEHPELSALVFSLYDADGQRREGFLRLPQIYDLELDADLVVLSGCRTALGRQVRGEGMVGLTRGFFAAGARRLVASLWRVQDRASAELMTRFYERLVEASESQPHASPSAVLREAQLALRDEPGFEDPYFWAAFAVYGDW